MRDDAPGAKVLLAFADGCDLPLLILHVHLKGVSREPGSAGDITLTMTGFSAAYAKLQKACAQPGYDTSEAPRSPRPLQFDAPRQGLPAWNNPNLAR